MARYIDADVLKEAILKERDAIPLTTTERYSFGVEKPYRDGNSMRGGIRKALRCLEQTPTANVAPIADTVRKMQERLKEAPIKVGLPLFGLQTKDEVEDYANGLILQMRDAIDQIAKEMLENTNES